MKKVISKSAKPIILAQNGCSWIQGHIDEDGKDFSFIDLWIGTNCTMVSMSRSDFNELVGLFEKLSAITKEEIGHA